MITIKKIPVLLFLLLSFPFFGQELVRIDTLKGKFQLNENRTSDFLTTALVPNNDQMVDLFKLNRIALKNRADLSLDFDLIDLESGYFYEPVQVKIRDSRLNLIPLDAKDLTGDLDIIKNNSKKEFNVTLQDAMENTLFYGYQYELEIICSLKGKGIKCGEENKPKFSLSFKDRWPYYATAAGGGILLILGNNYNTKSTNSYDNYSQKWKEGKSKEVAQPFFKDAKSRKNTRNAFLISGATFVSLSLGGLIYRYFFKHRPKVKTYNKYCGKKGSIPKKLDLGWINTSNGSGFVITF